MSKIEWTGETWNPLVGCTIHSAGCKGCYAMKDAYRLMHNPHPAIAEKFAGTAKMVNGHAVWTGRINFDEATLLKPLKRRVPTTYFVNSMSDLFHQAVADEQIDRIFAVMALCPQHTFQVLTKRADRMQTYLAFGGTVRRIMEAARELHRAVAPDPDRRRKQFHAWHAKFASMLAWTALGGVASDQFLRKEPNRSHPSWVQWPLPNVWAGVSIEDNRALHDRAYALKCTPAAVRFWSCEPLIGPFGDIPETWWPDWVICGGESGKGARPMHPDWARTLRDKCAAAGVPFFFKQWGEWLGGGPGRFEGSGCRGLKDWNDDHFSVLVGKGAAGRLLDGVEHNGMPAHG